MESNNQFEFKLTKPFTSEVFLPVMGKQIRITELNPICFYYQIFQKEALKVMRFQILPVNEQDHLGINCVYCKLVGIDDEIKDSLFAQNIMHTANLGENHKGFLFNDQFKYYFL